MYQTQPATDDDERWKVEADDLRHKGLGAIRDAAAKWHGSVSVILGVFSIVAFVRGPQSFPTDNHAVALLASCLVIGAAALAATSALLAAFAAQGSPKVYEILTGPLLKAHCSKAIKTASWQLRWSRILTVLGALLLFASVAIVWLSTLLSTKDTASPVHVLMVTGNGNVACVTITQSEGREDTLDTRVVAASVVPACP